MPWAAELHEKDGRFYFIFCSPGEGTGGRRSVCVGVADSPDRTFSLLAAPMWPDDQHSWIDPHIFADRDDARYLFVTRDTIPKTGESQIWAARLNDDLTGLAAPLQLCLTLSQPWEYGPQEGATVLLHGDTYYLMYSSNMFGSPKYAVGYATALTPLGPWTKFAGNPVLMRTGAVSGPGHNGVVRSPDGSELFVLYHSHITRAAGGRRQLALDRVRFKPQPAGPDRLIIDGPTCSPQALPAGVRPLDVVTGRDEFDGPELDRRRWVSVWNERPGAWRVEGGGLLVRALPGDVHEQSSNAANLFLQYAPQRSDWTATVSVEMATSAQQGFAMVTAWQDSENYVMLKKAALDGDTLEAALELNGVYAATYQANPFGDTALLRIQRQGNRYEFLASSDGQQWQVAGGAVTAELVDVKVGFGAFGTTAKTTREARFGWFELQRR